MKNISRFEEIKKIIRNENLPADSRDKSIRPCNDQDVSWLLLRVARLETVLQLILNMKIEHLSVKSLVQFIKDGLKE